MLVIRLQRTGRENNPTYRIVVAEKSAPVKGKYLPSREPVILELKTERIEHWTSKGAIPSDTVARLVSKKGMKGMDKYFKRYTKQRKKGEEPAAAAPPVAAAAPAPVAEAEAKEAGDTEKKEG